MSFVGNVESHIARQEARLELGSDTKLSDGTQTTRDWKLWMTSATSHDGGQGNLYQRYNQSPTPYNHLYQQTSHSSTPFEIHVPYPVYSFNGYKFLRLLLSLSFSFLPPFLPSVLLPPSPFAVASNHC